MIGKEEVEKMAFLARIKLSVDEVKKYSEDLESILQYAKKLEDVDTEKIEPLFHFSELKNIVREDKEEEIEKEVRDKMIEMGKNKEGYFRVKSIL
jgi:aspartyl-tRNA(Asn)/glutamyl-tRNA(Gln) amidotransferase subunit C